MTVSQQPAKPLAAVYVSSCFADLITRIVELIR